MIDNYCAKIFCAFVSIFCHKSVLFLGKVSRKFLRILASSQKSLRMLASSRKSLMVVAVSRKSLRMLAVSRKSLKMPVPLRSDFPDSFVHGRHLLEKSLFVGKSLGQRLEENVHLGGFQRSWYQEILLQASLCLESRYLG